MKSKKPHLKYITQNLFLLFVLSSQVCSHCKMDELEKELLEDLASSSDEESQHSNEQSELISDRQISLPVSINKSTCVGSLESRIETIIRQNAHITVEERLRQISLESVEDISELSRLNPLIEELKGRLDDYSREENRDLIDLLSTADQQFNLRHKSFIFLMNELTQVIQQEMSLIHSFIRFHYKVVFPELESLVLNPIDYCRVILIAKNDLNNIKAHEDDLRVFLSNEKVLVIIMSAAQHAKKQFSLSDGDLASILRACDLLLNINEILEKITDLMTSKLGDLAPNVSHIIGPLVTSQLLIATGSLKNLSSTPSCNIPALGVRDMSSSGNTRNETRQTGYLYHSELIRNLPRDVVKQALRIVSGKIVLAARVDLAKSSPTGDLGRKYRQEIENKIDKLLTPPERQDDKALPAPIDQKSKKRGGRRFRKMKERFQLSELGKAQNRLEFGKAEETMTNSFGEEVGLGMSRGSGGTLSARINSNTMPTMLKAMKNRLQNLAKMTSNPLSEDFESIILNGSDNRINLSSRNEGVHKNTKWFGGMLKRKNEEPTEAIKKKKF